MISNGLDKLFRGCWLIIKLNLFFILFSLLGGIVLGVGPAFQMVNDLLELSNLDYKEVTFPKAFERWKAHFLRNNAFFWSFLVLFGLLGYNLYLSVQIKGLIWLMIDFILMTGMIFLVVWYQYIILYETSYEIPVVDLIKLGFVSLFLSFGTFWKLLFGSALILVITWKMKGLLLFATFSLFIVWSRIATRKNREEVEKRLEDHVK